MEYADGTSARAKDGTPLPVGPVLYASSKYISGSCASENKDFMACKASNGDPKACMSQGQAVIRCVNSILTKVDSACPKELTAFSVCLDTHANKFEECRKEQSAFEGCAGAP
mmetsp:Transcript_31833/g.51417  ORF Transcript_31833/g.51417 Transcript_31833/m.51417 type:complete len:112 (+) Transcript_31833:69-404(+)|eukprot:CAMPEP_0179446566 /NCGR_PEP_ID=MMETSP0799-20121207/30031_1 /TAXON_ID=46947 /ORGANISM="Geminigera cryophila, Strain CCMP2564" /LENGTH=111 /DNA_ID=CAMNT_0021235775 /DNA_START=88 /DNA_END=423 /DNA_ORIENTATION=-